MEVGVSANPTASPSTEPARLPARRSGRLMVSPSQMDAYRRCPRVWYNQQVLKDREPEKPFQKRGTAIHKALEHYLKTGEVLPEVTLPSADPKQPPDKFQTLEFVQVAIPHIPKPRKDEFWGQFPKDETGNPTALLLLEQSAGAGLETFEEGPEVVQYIDVVEALPDQCRIIDYKTTSDFRYSKTPEELSENTQLAWNAKYMFQISDYDQIEIQHLYLLTKGRVKAKPVSRIMTRADVEKVWQRDMVTLREMVDWRIKAPATAEALPPNTDSCDLYGGCYYRKKCGFDTANVGFRKAPHPMSTTEKNSLLSQIVANAQKTTPGSTVTQHTQAVLRGGGDVLSLLAPKVIKSPAPAPQGKTIYEAPPPAAALPVVAAPTPAAAPAAKPSAADDLRSKLAARRAPVVQAKEEPDFDLQARSPFPPETARVAALPPNSILPPDAPSPVSTPEEVEAANASKAEAEAAAAPAEGKKRGRPKKQLTIEMDVPAVQGLGHANIAPQDHVDPRLLKSDSPLDGTLTNEGAVPTQTSADALNNVEELQEILKRPDPAFDCGCEVLFIDTLPAKGWQGQAPDDLATMMHTFERTAAQAADKIDYRFIPYEAKGYLTQAIRVLMRGLPRAVYVDSRLPGSDVFISAVTPYCKMIFRGTR